MIGEAGPMPILLGAAAGGLATLALREMAGGSATLPVWIRITLRPFRRARLEGYSPSSSERLRIASLLAAVAVVTGLFFAGPAVALALAAISPPAAGFLIDRGRRRYRHAVERAVPDAARAIADCLSAGHSPRGALVAVSGSLEGPAGAEFDRLRRELDLGRPTSVAVDSFARGFGSERIDAFATALISQRLAGGDLASLLRRFADGAAERDRVADDSRSATAQARFTGYLVVAMPAAAAVFAELLGPGFLAKLLASTPALAAVGVSGLMQAAGFVAISKLARIGEA